MTSVVGKDLELNSLKKSIFCFLNSKISFSDFEKLLTCIA